MKQEQTPDNIPILRSRNNRQANSKWLIKVGHTIFNKARLVSNSIRLPPQILTQSEDQRYSISTRASQKIVQDLFSSQVLRFFCSQWTKNSLRFYTRDGRKCALISIDNSKIVQFWKTLLDGIQESNFQEIEFSGQKELKIVEICSILIPKNFINLQYLSFFGCDIDNIQFLQTFNFCTMKELNISITKITKSQPIIKCNFNPNQLSKIIISYGKICQYNKTSRINLKNSNNIIRRFVPWVEFAQLFQQNNQLTCQNDMRSLVKLKNNNTNIIVNPFDYNKLYKRPQDLGKIGYPIVQRKINRYISHKINKMNQKQNQKALMQSSHNIT